MERVLIKVYAAFHPVERACVEAVRQAGAGAVSDEAEAWLAHENSMLRISFAGLYFPEEEVLDALKKGLSPQAEGKIDVLDIEAWELRRVSFAQGAVTEMRRGLNNILEYSSH